METIAARNPVKNPVVWIALILFIIGLVCWGSQLSSGFETYSKQYAWGVYLAGFFSAVAAGSGAMLTGCLVSLKGAKPTRLYLAGLASFVAAGFIIMADLGSPFNIFSLIFTSNLSAPMVMDFWLLALSAIFCLIGAFTGYVRKSGFAIIGLILAIALLGAEAWLIAMSAVQQLWSISMGATPAIIQALAAGFALILLVKPGEKGMARNGLAAMLAIFLASNLIDVLAGKNVNGLLGAQWQALLPSGVFWLGLLVGVLVPLALCLAKSLDFIAGVTALFGVFCAKLAYLWSGAALPGLDIFGEATPSLSFTELLVIVGFIGLSVLFYQLLKRGTVKHG